LLKKSIQKYKRGVFLDDKYLKKAIDEISSSKLIEMSQIPDIALYMDQITTFFEDKLKSTKRTDDDKILTKTMINNYTKSKLINPPLKKKYSKNHILSLILIYHLKSILSINDINKIFENSKDSIELLYESFLDIQSRNYSDFDSEISEQISKISEKCPDNSIAVCSIILLLINQANMRKQLAEKLIDYYFSESDKKCRD